MKPRIAIPLAIACALLAGGMTAANANGLLNGHPHLAYWFWALAAVFGVWAIVWWITDKNADGAPHFSLEVVDADLHSYGQYSWFFRLRNCGQRTARDIQFDPIVSKRNFHALRLSSVSSLAKDEMVPLTFRAGADEDWTINGVVNHLLLFCEDNPSKKSKLSYPVTIRFLDGGKRLEEHHVLECEPILPAGVRMKVHPR